MKKWIAVSLLLCLLCPVLLTAGGCDGCGKDMDAVYYLNFKPEVASVYDKIASAYKAETGKTLRVVTAASGTYEQTLKSEISKSDAPAIFQFNGPVGYESWKEYCADLSGTEIYKHLTDKDVAFKNQDGVWGVPYVVEGYGIIYNKRLTDAYFALPGRASTVGSMEEITSFSALRSVVEDMTRRKSELGIDGVFACTSLKSGEEWRWTTHLANVALSREFADNGTDLTHAEQIREVTFKYSDQYKQLFDLYLNNSTTEPRLLGSKQVSDSMAEFALEKCIMVQNGNWAWSQISGISGNKVKAENIKMMPIYMGIDGEATRGICVGTENYLAINAKLSEDKQRAAADFLYWLYSSDTGKAFVTNELAFISPFDTFGENETPSDPLSKDVMDWIGREDRKSITWDFIVFPGQNFKDDFGAALLQYAQGTKTWAQVKETFVTRWREERN